MLMEISSKRHRGFTLVEIMIVVAIIALLAVVALPGFIRARKRSQAARVIDDLRTIDSAVDQYALETNRVGGDPVSTSDWTNYVKIGTSLYITGQTVMGHPYGSQTVDLVPKVPPLTRTALSDVADTAFWSPYN